MKTVVLILTICIPLCWRYK